MTQNPSTLLRRALLADALVSGATGLLLLLAAGPLGALFGLPPLLLRAAGLAFLPWAALCAFAGTRAAPPAGLALAIVALNLAYGVASLAFPFTGWVAPTALGTGFVIGQGLVVILLAELQFFGLRRAGRAAAAPA